MAINPPMIDTPTPSAKFHRSRRAPVASSNTVANKGAQEAMIATVTGSVSFCARMIRNIATPSVPPTRIA